MYSSMPPFTQIGWTSSANLTKVLYFCKFEEKQVQVYFPAVLMPTYPLGQLMTAKPWNVFAHCSKLNYFWVDQKITQIQISKNLRKIKVESDIWSWQKQNIFILELKVVRKPKRPEKEPTNLIEKAFSKIFWWLKIRFPRQMLNIILLNRKALVLE